MSRDQPLADDFLARFQRKIARNAAAWLAFLREHGDDPAALERELANLTKAAQQALLEPQAWNEGLALLSDSWRHVERGYWRDWQGLLAQGLAVSRQAGRGDFEALLLDQLGETSRLAGDNQGAREHFEVSLALFRALSDQAGVGRTLAHLSQVQLALNEWSAATQSCQEAAAILAPLGHADDLAMVHNNWGLICQEQGQFDDALAHFQQAEATFGAQGNLRGQAKTLANRSVIHRRRQQVDLAESQLRQVMVLYQQLGDWLGLAIAQMNLSTVLYDLHRLDEALALGQEAEATFRRLRQRPFLARVSNNHGIFLSAMGRLAEAQDAFTESARLHLENGDRLYAASALCNSAEILIDQGRMAEARVPLAEAQALLESLAAPADWVLSDYETQRARLEAADGAQPVA